MRNLFSITHGRVAAVTTYGVIFVFLALSCVLGFLAGATFAAVQDVRSELRDVKRLCGNTAVVEDISHLPEEYADLEWR